MSSQTRARALIAKIMSGRLRHNPDVAELCRILAVTLDLGDDLDMQPRPAREIYHRDPTLYMRLYMRWWRATGQIGEGRREI